MSVGQEASENKESHTLSFDEINRVLEAYGREIQAEHTLMSQRMTWYVTSQSFLFSAYAISGSNSNSWGNIFMFGIPVLGMLLSEFARMSLWAAIEVQYGLIERQNKLITEQRPRLSCAKDQFLLDLHSKTTCNGRETKHTFHDTAMLPPLLIPILLMLTWPTFVFFRGWTIEPPYNQIVIFCAAAVWCGIIFHAGARLSGGFSQIERFDRLSRATKIWGEHKPTDNTDTTRKSNSSTEKSA
jgi:hypothetical protein